MSLYLKHRPDSFESMVGNPEEVNALQEVTQRENHPHVYLLSGSTGCGKTTAARIMARRFGISEVGIVEYNGSNTRGIDTAREIIERMRSTPMDGGAWGFILDEIHQATKDMQNALLKALEDTPGHVYFFLCTTDPQKLLPAVKNRCFTVAFKPMSVDELTTILRRVNKAEGAGLDREVILAIAENAQGSARGALVLMEKVMGVEGTEAQLKIAESGTIDEDSPEVIELCRALLDSRKGWADIAGLIKGIADDPEKVRWAVMGYMNSVLLSGKQNPRAAIILEAFAEPFYNTGKNGLTLAAYSAVVS